MPITVVAIFLLDFFNPFFFFFFFLLHDKNHGLHEDSGSGIVNRGWCAWAQNRHKRMDVES